MQDLERLPRPPRQPLEVHEAGHVHAGDDLGSRLLVVGEAIAPMSEEMASSFTAKVPPKPQHSSERDSGTSSIPSSCERSERTLSNAGATSSDDRARRSSRSPWHPWCSPTLRRNSPCTFPTFATSVRYSHSSKVLRLRCSKPAWPRRKGS